VRDYTRISRRCNKRDKPTRKEVMLDRGKLPSYERLAA